jgi:hypothetical protein
MMFASSAGVRTAVAYLQKASAGRKPTVATGSAVWTADMDCAPQLEEGAPPIGALGFLGRPEATMQGILNVFDQAILGLQERGE